MPLFDKLFSKGLGTILDKGADIADRFILTNEEKQEFEERQAEREFREVQYEGENYQKELDRSLQYYQIDQKDREDARTLNKVELDQDDKFIRRYRYYLATLIVVACFGCLGYLMFDPNPNRNTDYIMFFAGTLTSILSIVVSYFFGSSQGSMNKQDKINDMLNGKTNPSTFTQKNITVE